jgi:hypothetical protein
VKTSANVRSSRRLPALKSIALAVTLALSGVASAQYTSSKRDVFTANTGAWPAGGITLGGTTFVNLGLQGVGRVAGNSIDAATGETLGSISDMQITGFTNNGNGTYSGTFNFLPDRGYNSGATFSNYAARINTFNFTFTPYTAAAPAPSQNQIAMSFTGSTRFTYDHDNNPLTAPVYTTGLLATGTAGLFGTTVPTHANPTTIAGTTVNNRLTLDAEGLILDNRAGKAGTGWVGDEYGAYIYRFDANKQLVGQLQLPQALVPHSPLGTVNFAADPPLNGRRINQGMEGIAQSPDGNKVFALLQSATLQDSGSGNQGRSNTRLAVFDVSATDTPSAPVREYVIQLPRVDDNGGTPSLNRTAAQSAIIALNDHQLLILSRDGNGRGANNGSAVFKSVLLADLSNATNIAGSFGTEGAAVAPGGVLNASVTAIAWKEALNMLGTLPAGDLAKFGINLAANNGDANTISEKWEALGLVPIGDGSGQYFLFVGNDNDFQSRTGKLLDANGILQDYDAGLQNDTMVLAYRVAAVPEPEGYALMLAGLALVGVVARRRKQAA